MRAHAIQDPVSHSWLLLVLQVPFGMKMGAKVSVGEYIVHSMIPVFIGNTIAGVAPAPSPDTLLSILPEVQTCPCLRSWHAPNAAKFNLQSQRCMFWHGGDSASVYSINAMKAVAQSHLLRS